MSILANTRRFLVKVLRSSLAMRSRDNRFRQATIRNEARERGIGDTGIAEYSAARQIVFQ